MASATLARHQRSNSNSLQNPGPIANMTPGLPGAGRRVAIVSSRISKTEALDRLPARSR
jgi:hypothetical protein